MSTTARASAFATVLNRASLERVLAPAHEAERRKRKECTVDARGGGANFIGEEGEGSRVATTDKGPLVAQK